MTPAPNPAIDETCGLDATLILDASGSIQSAGAVNTVRNAGRDLTAALKDTNSTLRITQFATFSGQLSSRVPVNASTTGSGGALSQALANYYTPPPPRPAGVNIYNGGSIQNSALTWTNWEDGIKGIDTPELALFITDGDPTAYNVNSTRTNVNTSSTGTALDNAITQANALKARGTRMLVVGVGNGLTSSASQDRLKKISGPVLEKSAAALAGKTINEVDAVAFTDFAALGAFLRSVVTSLCGNSVTVQKLAQTSSGADYVPTTGWDVTVQPGVQGGFSWVDPTGPDNSAQTRATSGAQGTAAFQWKPKVASQKATVTVSEAVQTDFTADRWRCEIKAENGSTTSLDGTLSNQDPSFQFDMNPSDVASCMLYNDFDYAPALQVTKVAEDDPVRGNAAGWNEEYTFTVANTGNTPLTIAKPVDPQCASISAPSGPGAPGALPPGEEWTYTCQAKIGPVATVSTPLEHTNSVTVIGIDPNGTTVTGAADESIDVKTPAIHLEKTARKAGTDVVIPDGGNVPAGTRVTYVYTVTNTGNDVLQTVGVLDDRCDPVTRVSGSGTTLPVGQTWTYECTEVLNPPSTVSSVTNVATVTAKWSNPQDRAQNDGPVTDGDRMTINIDRAANLRIVKVTNPGEVDQDFPFTVSGQGVPAGDQAFDLNTSSAPATPPASRNIALDGPDGGGSEYTITESAVSGWDLTDLTCDKAPTSVTGGQVKVTILPEEDVTCTFTNERRPSLTITKQTSPAGSLAEFGFSAGLSPATFTLTDGQSQTYTGIAPGQVSITEDEVPAGWELDAISCSGTTVVSSDVDTGAVTVDLAYGEQAACVYTNGELPPATLTVVKDDVPATWDPLFPFEVQGVGLVDPGQPGNDSFDLGLGDATSYTVRPAAAGDTYTVTEGSQPAPPAGDSGFALTDIECVLASDPQNPVLGDTGTGAVDVLLTPGDSAVCTYVNQQKPRLTVAKTVINPDDPADDTEFSFTPSGALGGTDFALGNNQTEVFTDVAPGDTLTVTEASQSGWALTSLECTGAGSQDLTADPLTGVVTGDLGYGADVVCTYVNTRDPSPAYLFVMKNTDPADSSATFDFNATDGAAFDEDFSLGGGDYQGFEVNPGTGTVDYTVSEAGKPGWRLTELDCVKNTDPSDLQGGDLDTGGVTITLGEGEVGVCVFENQQLGTLSVDKVTDVASAREFDFTATGVTPGTFSLTGGGSPQVYAGIVAGTVITVTEDVPTAAPDRWSLSDITCDGTTGPAYDLATGEASFTMGAGEDVDCTYSDVKVPAATVQIVKAADPADGTQFAFAASGDDGGVSPADESFTLAPDGDIAVKTMTVHPAADGESFRFAEPGPLPAGWNLTDIECVNGGDVVGSTDFTAAGGHVDVNIDPGDTITCTFTDVKDATLTVVKEAPDDPSQDFDFEWTAGADFTLRDQQSRSATGLSAGQYTVAEVDLPADWYLDGPEGEHPTCVGTAAAVDYTPELGATVDLAPGEQAVCTFADFFEYDPQITLVKTPDRQVVLEGKPVIYTYTVTNSGNVNVNTVGALNDTIEDDRCSPVTYVSGGTPPTMAPGDSWSFTCTVSAMTTNTATNVALATMQGPDGPITATDTATVEVLVPALDLVKTVDQPVVYPGTGVTYTYVATNTGQTPFEGPAELDDWITDDTCSPVGYHSGDVGGDAVLDVGESWRYLCSMPISADTTNTATFTGTPFVAASPDSGDKQTGEPMQATATADVEVIQKGIAITKTPSAPGGVMKDGTLLVPLGTEVTYTYEVTSGAATVPMDVLDVTDNKCAPVQYQSGDTSGDGMVDPGETWIYTCKAVFNGISTVTNTVVVTAVEPILGGLAEDSDHATVKSYKGSIAIKKSPSAELVPKGTPVTFTYTAMNDGTVDLTDVTVVDDKCAPVTYVSGDDGDGVMKPGDEWTFRCVSPLTDDTTNVAEATGTTPSGGKVTDSTSVTVLVVGGRLNPAIAVTKTPSATQVDEGGKVTYRYEVTNAGTMPLANIRMSDDKCSPVTYVSGDDNGDGLLTSSASGEGWPDETWIYTCTTRITKKTTNTVTATGSPWNAGQVVGADVSAVAKATVTVTKQLPINVDPVKNCKGGTCVKASKTNKYGTLKYRTKCRPVGSSAAGEVSYCRTKVTKNGAVKVKVFGYRKVKVTVWITAVPKPKYKDTWNRNTWRRTWVIRP